ncbi:zinc ribbon domain-containing protein [Cupriavidus necator]|uniref:zinc ribbon domain-containing protein n=1 Tax=Cupriavidus necator TaxID=106590 RepID=UPI0005B49F06|nr:zinc ribbon domain-containing protein [Cupriavidus necator]
MRCEKCQSELSPDDRFCSVCGHPVAAVAPLPLSPDSVVCPACGARRPSDERFCGECGQSLQGASPQAQKTQIPPSTPTSVAGAKRRRWPYALAASVGIAVLGGLGFMGYRLILQSYGYYIALAATAGIAVLGGLNFIVYRHFRRYRYFFALAAIAGIAVLGGLRFIGVF